MCRLPSQCLACATVAGFLLATSAFAQTAASSAAASASTSAPSDVAPVALVAPTAAPTQTEVPDGSPQLAQEKVISNTSTGATGSSNPGRSARSASTVVVNEERIQGRLASAHVSVGGAKGYTVVDPDAGRTDRQSNNGGKRLSPSTWELFRF